MKKFIRALPVFVLGCVLLASCGGKAPNTPSKRKDPVAPAPPQPQVPCPTAQPTNLHKVIVNMTHAMPTKMGLKLEGDKEYRLSECADTYQRGVSASWKRNTNMQLEITVEHGAAFNNSLPDVQGLEVWDLKGCGTTPPDVVYKSATPLKISWRTENPVANCPHSRATGIAVNAAPPGEPAEVTE